MGRILIGGAALVTLTVGAAFGSPAGALAPRSLGDEPRIVFTAGCVVASIAPDGTGKTYLTEQGCAGWPSWAPGQAHIAYYSAQDDPNGDIFTVDADGANEDNLTGFRGPQLEILPAWSPLGDEIAMCTGDVGVAVFPLDGSSVRKMSGFLVDCPGIAWSPDGSRIVYSARYKSSTFELWIVDADGSGRRRLTRSDSDEQHPDWSPDGRTIVFERYGGRDSGIFVVNTDGTGLKRLTPGRSFDMDPAWSPDGTRIAFARDAYHTHIWTMNADGSDPRQVTQDFETGLNFAPDW